ncbi:MAG TPA: hypothetical protein P5232_03600 [Candidatus Moranbacteria bacterium]|nr:hypothetical protein [Candidatus Moranbacteria bacterium]
MINFDKIKKIKWPWFFIISILVIFLVVKNYLNRMLLPYSPKYPGMTNLILGIFVLSALILLFFNFSNNRNKLIENFKFFLFLTTSLSLWAWLIFYFIFVESNDIIMF